MKKEIKQIIKETHTSIQMMQIQNLENSLQQDLHWAGLKGKIELLFNISIEVLDNDEELLKEIEATKRLILSKLNNEQ
jgi:hypothetical protein